MTVPHVQSGQQWTVPPAADHNAMADAANWVAANARGDTFDRGRRQRDYDTILIRNVSGAPRQRGQVLAIRDPVHPDEPTDLPEQYAGRPIHDGDSPTHPADCGRFAVLDEALAEDAIGRAVVSGLCVGYVNINDECHRWADVGDGAGSLQSYPSGSAHIEWWPGGTGLQLCLLKIGHLDAGFQRCQLTTRLECGGCASAVQLSCTAGDCAEPQCEIEVCDVAKVIAEPVEISKQVWAKYNHATGQWEVVSAERECSEDCNFTGDVTVGTGVLDASGCTTVSAGRVAMTFDRGKLCDVVETSPDTVDLPYPEIAAGTCISVVESDSEEDGPCGKLTINNTMTLTGEDCISVSGEGCAKTIKNTMQIAPGDCISVAVDGCTRTITNTMRVVGGDGIHVEREGCAFAVSLAGNKADPQTTLRVLCGVELTPITISCVGSSGGWSFAVEGGELTEHFTDVTLPASLVEVVSDCGSGGEPPDPDPPAGCDDCPECEEWQNLVYNPTTENCACMPPWLPPPDDYVYCGEPKPVPQCSDCPECGAGQQKIMQIGTGVCDCIDEAGSIPEGWIPCADDGVDPPECGFTINSIDCSSFPPHISATLGCWPTDAVSVEVTVIGDQGSSAIVGPTEPGEIVEGQEYWWALNNGWESPESGENFSITIVFRDANGFGVAYQYFTGACS